MELVGTIRKAGTFLRANGLRKTVNRLFLRFGRKKAEKRMLARTRVSEEELRRQREQVFDEPLKFSIAVPLYNTPVDVLREMIQSVQEQSYRDWELCLADGSDEAHDQVGAICREMAAGDDRILYRKLERNDGISGNSNAAAKMGTGNYLALLDHDDLLAPNALFEMRSAIARTKADFVYSDELTFQSPRRDRVEVVRLKPGFAPDTLLTNNYICHFTVFSRELWNRAGGFRSEYDGSQDHDLFLRLTEKAKGIAHVAKVLYLWRSIPGSVAEDIQHKEYAISAGRRAVRDFLREARGIEADVQSTEVFPTMYHVVYPILGKPMIRIVLDGRKETGDPKKKLLELQRRTGWDECRWTMITRADSPEETEDLKGADTLQAKDGESRRDIWTRAAEAGDEEYLLFLDGIPEVMTDGWLREMLGEAQQGHVGAVGAKLYSELGNVRHAGVTIGMGPGGIAGRPYCLWNPANDGYFGQISVMQNMAAVTDCLLIAREKWKAAGGFSEAYQDALFDVDLCLRLLEKGYYNVFDPHARLKMGLEKDTWFDVGREYGTYAWDAKIFRERNESMLKSGDPFFNPNLSLKHEDWRYR